MSTLGSFRHTVLVQKKIKTSDGQGGFRVTWQDVGEFPCQVTTISLRERNRFGTYNIDVTHRVRMRDSGDEGNVIDEHMRMFDVTNDASHAPVFDIISVEDVKQRDRYLSVLVMDQSAKRKRL